MDSIRSLVRRWLKPSKKENGDMEDLRMLEEIAPLPCDTDRLRSASTVSLDGILNDEERFHRWKTSTQEIARLGIPDVSRAVNRGDRRALHYLVDYFSPKSVLEVGTHIGASTAKIARVQWLHRNADGKEFKLTSVDVKDVNSEQDRYWQRFGAQHSPRELMQRLGVDDSVYFVAQDSLQFLGECTDRFDFIFLDGNHRASHVYREIPLALERLNPGGVILLHDFCPEGKKLWQQEPTIIGPYMAVERHRKEGKALTALPLGNLPWETKYGSHTTSLALLLKDA